MSWLKFALAAALAATPICLFLLAPNDALAATVPPLPESNWTAWEIG